MLPVYDPRASRNDNERTSPQVNSVVYRPVGRFIHLCTLRWSDDGLPRPTTADTTIKTICSLMGLIPRPGPVVVIHQSFQASMSFIWLQVLGRQLVPRTTICAGQTLKSSRPMVYKTREVCPRVKQIASSG
jgi:hypothetical protein